MVDATNTHGPGPAAMLRVLSLFDVLAANPEGFSLTDLSEVMEVPKSTLLNSLRGLVLEDYLLLEGSIYRLGPKIFPLASSITAQWSLSRIVRGYMQSLASKTGETVTLSIIDLIGRRYIHIDVIDGTTPLRYVAPVGSSADLYTGAAGRVLLAFQAEDYVEQYLQEVELTPLTSHTVTNPEVLRAQLEEVRNTRHYVNLGETFEDVGAIVAGIFGPRGEIAAAMGISAPLTRIKRNLEEWRMLVCDHASHASGMA